MSVPVERCGDCNEYHYPGPCYPTGDEHRREDGWRLYKATRIQTFPREASDDNPRQDSA